MIVGYLYKKTEAEVKKEVEKGVEVVMGVDVSSIIDTINLHEINNVGHPDIVLALLKQECMLILGKIKVEENKESGKDEN